MNSPCPLMLIAGLAMVDGNHRQPATAELKGRGSQGMPKPTDRLIVRAEFANDQLSVWYADGSGPYGPDSHPRILKLDQMIRETSRPYALWLIGIGWSFEEG